MHDGVTEALAGFPVKTATPCEGTGYEIGSMSIVKGARNLANAKKFYDWALTPEAQKLEAQAKQFQVPSNKATPVPPEAPKFADMKLIDYDQAKYGKSAERKRLIARWDAEVGAPAEALMMLARAAGVVGRGPARGRRCCPGTRCRKASTPAPGCRGLWSSEDYAGGLAADRRARQLVAGAGAAGAGRLPRDRRRCRCRASGAATLAADRRRRRPRCCSWPQALASACAAGTRRGSTRLFGELDGRQVGIGAGGALVLIALLALLSIGLALRGAFGGDAFVAGAVTAVAASIVLFTAWPILRILVQAFQDGDGVFAPALLLERLAAEKIWSLRCLAGGGRCGVAWNTLFLALGCGAGTTALGLAFALIATRTGFRLQEDAARADGAADHHAALRDRPGADPGVRPLRPGEPVPRMVDGRRRRRAGSTASRACSWRSSSPSRRSPSWC